MIDVRFYALMVGRIDGKPVRELAPLEPVAHDLALEHYERLPDPRLTDIIIDLQAELARRRDTE